MNKKLLMSVSVIVLLLVLSLSLVACASPEKKVSKKIYNVDDNYKVTSFEASQAKELFSEATGGWLVRNKNDSQDIGAVFIFDNENSANMARLDWQIDNIYSKNKLNISNYENVLVLGTDEAYREIIKTCKLD